jgi:hypothetical protein
MLTKIIAASKKAAYVHEGWEVSEVQPEGLHKSLTQVQIDDSSVTTFTLARTDAFLIQRAKIRRPLSFSQHRSFMESVDIDHMGYPELTTNAITQMLRRIRHHFFDYSVHRRDDITLHVENRKYALRVFSYFEGDNLNKYLDQLGEIQKGTRQTRGPTFFDTIYTLPKLSDVWIDVANDTIFSYDRQFMNRVVGHLQTTFMGAPG